MSELRDAIDKALPGIMSKHSANLVTERGVKVVIFPEAADAIIALIEQSRPSRDEFEQAVTVLMHAVRDECQAFVLDLPSLRDIRSRTFAARREVMRMAGYGEEQ